MNEQETKCVVVVDESLPLGMIANTAIIMGMTLGKKFPKSVGSDVYDKDGNCHLGITALPVPILKADAPKVKALRETLYKPEFSELMVVDFSDVAQRCNAYDDFIEQMKKVDQIDLNYFGIAICGNKKQVNKLTGSMPLLR